jgi:adenine-specific DNA-methyltransferase
LVVLSEDVGSERTLLVCCSAFKVSAAILNDRLSNLTLKKMPHALLSKCEWGKDDYSLNISKLPVLEPDDGVQEVDPKKKVAKNEADLFGDE